MEFIGSSSDAEFLLFVDMYNLKTKSRINTPLLIGRSEYEYTKLLTSFIKLDTYHLDIVIGYNPTSSSPYAYNFLLEINNAYTNITLISTDSIDSTNSIYSLTAINITSNKIMVIYNIHSTNNYSYYRTILTITNNTITIDTPVYFITAGTNYGYSCYLNNLNNNMILFQYDSYSSNNHRASMKIYNLSDFNNNVFDNPIINMVAIAGSYGNEYMKWIQLDNTHYLFINDAYITVYEYQNNTTLTQISQTYLGSQWKTSITSSDSVHLTQDFWIARKINNMIKILAPTEVDISGNDDMVLYYYEIFITFNNNWEANIIFDSHPKWESHLITHCTYIGIINNIEYILRPTGELFSSNGYYNYSYYLINRETIQTNVITPAYYNITGVALEAGSNGDIIQVYIPG